MRAFEHAYTWVLEGHVYLGIISHIPALEFTQIGGSLKNAYIRDLNMGLTPIRNVCKQVYAAENPAYTLL